jgi:hypothetical protein
MSFDITFGRGEPLPPGIYDAVVDSADLKDTRYGEKILVGWTVPEHGAKVEDWAKPSSHPKSNCYLWFTTINPSIKATGRVRPEDILSWPCRLELDVYVDSEGSEKNKIVRVLPAEEE